MKAAKLLAVALITTLCVGVAAAKPHPHKKHYAHHKAHHRAHRHHHKGHKK